MPNMKALNEIESLCSHLTEKCRQAGYALVGCAVKDGRPLVFSTGTVHGLAPSFRLAAEVAENAIAEGEIQLEFIGRPC